MSYFIKQSTATRPLLFLMVLSSDHISPATGLTPTVTLSKAGASFASPAGVVTEIANGWYQVAANATDSSTLGPLILHATGTSADPTDVIYRIVAFDPDSATNLGLSNLDTTVTSRSAPATAQTIDFTTTLPASPVANSLGEALFFTDLLGGRVGTAQGGTSTSITLDAGASSDTNAYIGDDIYLYGGTGGGVRGSGQRRTATAYNTSTKVVTVHRAWATVPDSTTKFITFPQPQANVGIWNSTAVAVSLPGSGTLSTYAGGAVASVAAAVTVATNNDKTGYQLAANGLDVISTSVPTSAISSWNYRERMIMLFRRFFGKAAMTATQLKTLASDGTTVLSTQNLLDDGATQTQGEAA